MVVCTSIVRDSSTRWYNGDDETWIRKLWWLGNMLQWVAASTTERLPGHVTRAARVQEKITLPGTVSWQKGRSTAGPTSAMPDLNFTLQIRRVVMGMVVMNATPTFQGSRKSHGFTGTTLVPLGHLRAGWRGNYLPWSRLRLRAGSLPCSACAVVGIPQSACKDKIKKKSFYINDKLKWLWWASSEFPDFISVICCGWKSSTRMMTTPTIALPHLNAKTMVKKTAMPASE